jgi:uncharacterized membrane protein
MEASLRLRLWILASLASGWMLSVWLATESAAGVSHGRWAYLSTAAVYASGSLICHQRPERSFFLNGSQMPVCARCAGLYAGAAIGALVLAMRGVGRRMDAGRIRWVLAGTALPTGLTLVYEAVTGDTPANIVRALAGLPLGASIAWAIGVVSASSTSVELN